MKRATRAAAMLLSAVLLALGFAGGARAQGVTTSAIAGRVTNEQGAGVQGATVVATNTRTGAEYRVVTRSEGRYALQGLQPGGPYTIRVSGLGYATQTRTGISLTLSQTELVDFSLAAQAVALEGITAVAEDADAIISPGRTGAATVISDSAITRLPTITRDFTDFTRLVPQLSTGGQGTTAGGRNNRFNNIQIDGAVNNDLFGLAASGTPGGQAGTKPISLEAIQEFQVVLAPFDVRQGGFTGAGINAITKSGTNEWDGSVTFFTRNEGLVGNYRFPLLGNNVNSADIGEFGQREAAFSLGGPIVRDRAFFFVAGEISRREAPAGVFIRPNAAGTGFETVGGSTIPGARVDSVYNVLSNQYGYNPGTIGDVNLQRESDNLFGRLDFNLGANNRLTVRHNYVKAFDDNFFRTDAAFPLGDAGYIFNSTTNATVAQLNSTFFGQYFNELRVGYTTVRDNRDVPTTRFPRIEVDLAGCAGTSCRVVAGPENFSIANALDQDILEITNDLSFSRGIHNITVGTHNEFFSFSNLFARNLYGLYRFNGITNFRNGIPSRYEFSFFNDTVAGASERAEFPVQQWGIYAQDRVGITEGFTLTAGVRYDLTRFPDPPGRNQRFEQAFTTAYQAAGLGAFTRRTDQIPDNTGVLNARLGFNWDVTGDATTQIRGGVGTFSGRTPYVWISNAYGNTGLDYTRFTCTAAGTIPAFNKNPDTQLRGCLDPATGQVTQANTVPNEINLVSPDFELPRVLRYSLAVDREIAWGIVGTLEWLYNKSINDPVYRDLTIGNVTTTIVEGRPTYGRVSATGFGNVYDVFNTDENYSYTMTGQLQRPFRDGWEASIAYTYGRSYDVNALRSSQASSSFRFNPIVDSPNDPALRPSDYDVPHRFVASFTRQLEYLRRAPTDFSVVWVGESGRPYSYTYNGDVNGDGSDANDLIYVPASAAEARFEGITSTNPLTPEQSWQNLNAFIESVDCLREARGQVLKRNACRAPWRSRFDVRVAQTIPTLRGQGAQITLDILNFANLLNEDWGVTEEVVNQNEQLLARRTGNPVNGRILLGGFAPKPQVFRIEDLNSRYQIQLGIRYTF